LSQQSGDITSSDADIFGHVNFGPAGGRGPAGADGSAGPSGKPAGFLYDKLNTTPDSTGIIRTQPGQVPPQIQLNATSKDGEFIDDYISDISTDRKDRVYVISSDGTQSFTGRAITLSSTGAGTSKRYTIGLEDTTGANITNGEEVYFFHNPSGATGDDGNTGATGAIGTFESQNGTNGTPTTLRSSDSDPILDTIRLRGGNNVTVSLADDNAGRAIYTINSTATGGGGGDASPLITGVMFDGLEFGGGGAKAMGATASPSNSSLIDYFDQVTLFRQFNDTATAKTNVAKFRRLPVTQNSYTLQGSASITGLDLTGALTTEEVFTTLNGEETSSFNGSATPGGQDRFLPKPCPDPSASSQTSQGDVLCLAGNRKYNITAKITMEGGSASKATKIHFTSLLTEMSDINAGDGDGSNGTVVSGLNVNQVKYCEFNGTGNFKEEFNCVVDLTDLNDDNRRGFAVVYACQNEVEPNLVEVQYVISTNSPDYVP
jgi:hypothetical protein